MLTSNLHENNFDNIDHLPPLQVTQKRTIY